MTNIYFFIVILLSLMLNACSIFSPVKTEPANKFVVTSIPPPQMTKTRRAGTLMVTEPNVKPFYNATDMIYSKGPYSIAAYSKNSWADPPAQMLQPLIIQTLENTLHFKAVIPTTSLGKYDYILNSQLIDFKQVFFGRESIFQITLRVELIDEVTRNVIAEKEFSVSAFSPQNSPFGGVVAANCATEKLLTELTTWCLRVLR